MSRQEFIEAKKIYEAYVKRKTLFIVFLFLVLTLLTPASISIGSANLGLREVASSLLNKFLPNYPVNETTYLIIWNLRLPRVLMAIASGAALAASGMILQVILRNPLASPYTLGISSSAAFGASLAVILGAGVIGYKQLVFINLPMITVNAFCISIISAFTISLLSKIKGATVETMVLAGIAITYLFSALTSLIQYFGTEEQVAAIVFWMFGDLGKADWINLSIVSATTILSLPILLKLSWDYNALILGDEIAKSLGVHVDSLRIVSMILATLLTAVSVSFLGTIGFIGLLAPHIARMLVGGDHRFLLPTSCLIGAILLLTADMASRRLLPPLILPVGVLTSLLGVPLFLYLLLRRKREYW